MKFDIFQVVNTREHGWMGWEERVEFLKTENVDLNLYRLVYTGEIEEGKPYDVLHELFERFSIAYPADYTGRSMSVGDVVRLDGRRCFYCDSFGWKELKDVVFQNAERLAIIAEAEMNTRSWILVCRRFLEKADRLSNQGIAGFISANGTVFAGDKVLLEAFRSRRYDDAFRKYALEAIQSQITSYEESLVALLKIRAEIEAPETA